MSFPEHCRTRSPRELLLMAMLGVSFIGWVDYLTGWEVSFFLFYAAPILFSVWFLDKKRTLLIVLLSAIVWWWADWQDGHPYFATWVQFWETGMRLGFFAFAAVGGWAIKTRSDSIEAWVNDIRRLRALERDLIAASEREQQRIGADLHDGLCQHLAGITCMTGSLRDDLEGRFQQEAQTVAEIHELLKDAIVQARNIARGISPVQMDEAGLLSALENLADNVARLHGVECVFQTLEESLSLDREVAVNLYRIAQEACSNAVRHGHARDIVIGLEVVGPEIILTVEDDGIGIGSDAGQGKGMGLRSMLYRAGILGGTVTVSGVEDSGTRVTCKVPLHVAADHDLIAA